ncbi:hypothetical protein LWS67_05730 [Bacillus atrophaeus]|uniref:hypothetical protein n=1 Tax=Bacillus atrophaeus TaxID=1452 RepID=UPI001EFB76A1|nr:hypothetical protein [Bacillus atrophaeus]MCG8396106.1 hypothetical protein [Bacillus atrophaeus]
MYKYSDEEFKEKVRDKIGNVRSFKKHLREIGLIGNRQQFSEKHVQMFEEIREYKIKNHTTWDLAFQNGLKNDSQIEKTIADIPNTSTAVAETSKKYIEDTLTEILKTLKRIEQKI